MRLIAIGDIHGQLQMLLDLLNKVVPCESDRLVFFGDYIDRGPNSKGVIDCLIEFQKRFPQSIFIRGNHEQMLLDALDDCINFGLWTQNGGLECLKSYGVEKDELASVSDCCNAIPQQHIDFLNQTKLYHRQDGFLFIHAGADESLPLDQQPDTLLWDCYAPPGINEIHVVGHVPCLDNEPYFEDGRYNLDTGAGYYKKLTACDVLTREVWQTI